MFWTWNLKLRVIRRYCQDVERDWKVGTGSLYAVVMPVYGEKSGYAFARADGHICLCAVTPVLPTYSHQCLRSFLRVDGSEGLEECQ